MKILLIVILGVLGLALSFFGYYGIFRTVKPVIKMTGGETLAYKSVRGDYRKSGSVSDEVYYGLVDKLDLETFKGFGIYFDDPRSTAMEELRSDVGCIIEEKDLVKVDQVKAHYEVKQLPKGEYLVADFPLKGPLSIFLGVLKVYPQLRKAAIANEIDPDGFVMEIWDVPNKMIHYRKEIR